MMKSHSGVLCVSGPLGCWMHPLTTLNQYTRRFPAKMRQSAKKRSHACSPAAASPCALR
jgi:hypothetical protein